MPKAIPSWHVSVAAEALTASLFARCGYDVSVQYGPNQPEYDLVIAQGERLLKVSVKGSQDGGWGLCQNFLTKGTADYHDAIDRWQAQHKPRTIFAFVQFKDVGITELPRVYLATPKEVAKLLRDSARRRGGTILYERQVWGPRAYGAGTIDQIPGTWRFSPDRVRDIFAAA